jgi:hypothetical protein
LEGDRKSLNRGSGIDDDSESRSLSVGEPVWEKYGLDSKKGDLGTIEVSLKSRTASMIYFFGF